jgi:hypothetical protein
VFVYKYMRSEQVRADACVIARGEWNRHVLASFSSRIRGAAQCAAPRTAQCVCRPGPVPLSIAARCSRLEKAEKRMAGELAGVMQSKQLLTGVVGRLSSLEPHQKAGSPTLNVAKKPSLASHGLPSPKAAPSRGAAGKTRADGIATSPIALDAAKATLKKLAATSGTVAVVRFRSTRKPSQGACDARAMIAWRYNAACHLRAWRWALCSWLNRSWRPCSNW